jgi:hypothetical protein
MDRLILLGVAYYFYMKNKQSVQSNIDGVLKQSRLSNELLNKQNRLESMFKSQNKFDTGNDIIGNNAEVLM